MNDKIIDFIKKLEENKYDYNYDNINYFKKILKKKLNLEKDMIDNKLYEALYYYSIKDYLNVWLLCQNENNIYFKELEDQLDITFDLILENINFKGIYLIDFLKNLINEKELEIKNNLFDFYINLDRDYLDKNHKYYYLYQMIYHKFDKEYYDVMYIYHKYLKNDENAKKIYDMIECSLTDYFMNTGASDELAAKYCEESVIFRVENEMLKNEIKDLKLKLEKNEYFS